MTTPLFSGSPDDSQSENAIDGMKEFRVQSMSIGSSFVFLLGAPVSVALYIGVLWVLGANVFAFFVGVAAIVGTMIGLYRYLLQKILVTVGRGAILVRYLYIPFFMSKPDMEFAVTDIASYQFDYINGARFKLYLKDKRSFKIGVGSASRKQRRAIEEMSEYIIALITRNESSQPSGLTGSRRYGEGTSDLI